jgi:hypothetical protein
MRSRSPQLLSLEETALVLGIGRLTIYRALCDGRVPFPVHRIGGSGTSPSGRSSTSWKARRQRTQRARRRHSRTPDSERQRSRKVWIRVRIIEAVVKVGRRPPGGPGLDDGVPESPTATMRKELRQGLLDALVRVATTPAEPSCGGPGVTPPEGHRCDGTESHPQESSNVPMCSAAFWSSFEMASV